MLRRAMMASGGGAPPVLYLDSLAIQPRAVLSLKKLISTATLALRVRRSSDNAEQDIGFSGDALDTAALASFAGAGSAFVVTVYDQTGNGEHLEQATATKQPRIYNAGSYDGLVVFDGTSDGMKITGLSLSQPQLGVYTRGAFPASAGTTIFMEASANWNSNTYCWIFYTQTNRYEIGMNSGVAATQRASYYTGVTVGALNKFTLLLDRALTGTAEMKLYEGGAQKTAVAINANEMAGSFATHDLYVGGRAAGSLFTAPSIESLVFYDGDTAALRADIEALL